MINPKTAAKQWLRKVERRTAVNAHRRDKGNDVGFMIDRWIAVRNHFFTGKNAYRALGNKANREGITVTN